jgi:hypothetical protein
VVSASRNAITEKAGHDYLMWIDSDMKFPPYGIYRLIQRDKDIIGGLYFRKEVDARPQIYKLNDEGFFETMYDIPTMKEPFQVDGIATGFLLIKRKVLEAFTPEFCNENWYPFDMGRGPSNKEEGEDLSFCRRARKLGFEIWCDPTIPLGHVGRKIFGKEDYDSAQMMKKYWANKTQYSNDIDGWMSVMELNWLRDMAEKSENVVEVGSWKGRSTHAILSGCKGKVIAVDTWEGSEDERHGKQKEALNGNLYQIFMENVGSFQNLEPWKMLEIDAADKIPDKSVDMVFLDADHRYEKVKKQIQRWLPKAKKILCGHDFDSHETQEAVTEIFGDVDTVESLWIVHLDKE